jgi:hypothetical protein
MWQLFKSILSIIMLGLAALAFKDSMILGSVFALLAIAIWIDYSNLEINPKMIGLIFSFMFTANGFNLLKSDTLYPMVCKGRGRLLCDLENMLFALGGVRLIAMFYFVFALAFFYLGFSKSSNKNNDTKLN